MADLFYSKYYSRVLELAFLFEGGVEAVAAQRLVLVGFTDEHLLVRAGALDAWKAVRMLGRLAAAHADGVNLGDVLGPGQKSRHRTERIGQIVHVQTSHDNSYTLVGQSVADVNYAIVKELDFIYSHNIHIGGIQQDVLGGIHADGLYGMAFMTDHIGIRVAVVYGRLEYLHPLMGEIRPLEPTDKLFCLAREHTSADNFKPAGLFCTFKKHFSYFCTDTNIVN